ncbi:MAG: Uncharacterised protein [Owenweeksia sp. TMED14]|nr:MAG: Uncharacterised protein [Owenweeksia sp. TMED14]|tara:strand:+ start:164 stop:952 length:789 start_codon:yes stop_codon:yes gene_type:complete
MTRQLINWLKASVINKWIGILSLCFLFQTILEIIGWILNIPFEQGLINFFALKNELNWKIHSLLTYGFLHNGLFHFIFNLFMLHFSAQILQTFWRPKQVIRLFLLGIISGGFSFLFGTLILGKTGAIVGSSAGIFAILFAAARFSPNMSIYLFGIFPMPLWLISTGLLLVSITGLNGSNFGGELAHLGGSILGLIIAKRPDFFNKRKFYLKRNRSMQIDRSNSETESDRTKYLNSILDKVGSVGYEKLNEKEKAFLKRYGEK